MKLKTTPEEIEAQCQLPKVKVDFIDYEVEVMKPETSAFDKIAYAARTCYRSEEVANVESNKKLIKGCVKRGHTSVLEHGALSLYLSPRPDDETSTMIKNILGTKGRPVALRQLWERLPTLSSQRYSSQFNDSRMFSMHYDDVVIDGHKFPKDADIALPVIVADIRAWRDILAERLFISDNVTSDPISWFITVTTIWRMYNVLPEAFSDLCDAVIQRIKNFKTRRANAGEGERFSPLESLLFGKLTDEELGDNFCLAKFLDKYWGNDFKSVIAEEVDPSMTVTIVLTTDRAVTHEHVRHRRDVGYSQESQRYVNYGNKGYQAMKFTCDPSKTPEGVEVGMYDGIVADNELGAELFKRSIENSFATYDKLISLGFPPEVSRKVLPNNCRTKIVVTWLLPIGFSNFMRWRTEKFAQYDIRLAADKILLQMLRMKHPFLGILGSRDLRRWFTWMQEQEIFDKKVLDEIDAILTERSQVEAELMRQAEEEAAAREAARLEQMKKEADGPGIVVDDHTTKPVPDPSKPPAIIKVGGGTQDAKSAEPVTERPATVQLEPTEEAERGNGEPRGGC